MPKRSDSHCRWCAEPRISNQAPFCSRCGRPIRGIGYMIYMGKILSSDLLLPISIVILTFVFATVQNKKQTTVDDAHRLSEAFAKLGDVEARMRKDQAAIDLVSRSVPEQYLRDHLLDFDEAFDKYEPTLAPFEEFESRIYRDNHIADVWRLCFLVPYYGSEAPSSPSQSYWEYMKHQFESCEGQTCPAMVANKIDHAMWQLYSGTCACKTPNKVPIQVPREWFWLRMRALMDSEKTHSFPAQFVKVSRGGDPNVTLYRESNVDCPHSLTDENAQIQAGNRRFDDRRSR
jgi:hypothetical protein